MKIIQITLILFFATACFDSDKGEIMKNKANHFKVTLIHEVENDNGDGCVNNKSNYKKEIDSEGVRIFSEEQFDLLTTKPQKKETKSHFELKKNNRDILYDLLITLVELEEGEYGSSEYLNDEGVDQYSLRVEILGKTKTYHLLHSTLSDPSIPASLSTSLIFIQALKE